jgi:hypothetical protein
MEDLPTRARRNLSRVQAPSASVLSSPPSSQVQPALLMNLEPENVEALLAWREDQPCCLGGNGRSLEGRILSDPGRYIYFKANGRKPIEVCARAELVRVEAKKPDPRCRLPGYEKQDDDFYLIVQRPSHLESPIPIEKLVNYNTDQPLLRSSQGIQKIVDPLS